MPLPSCFFPFLFSNLSFIAKLSYRMLTTTTIKFTMMLLLVALATVKAYYTQDILPTCQTAQISDNFIDYCCPCPQTFFSSCVSTAASTCGQFKFKPGSAKCSKGQWGCYQDRRSSSASALALSKAEEAVDFLAEKLISLGQRPA